MSRFIALGLVFVIGCSKEENPPGSAPEKSVTRSEAVAKTPTPDPVKPDKKAKATELRIAHIAVDILEPGESWFGNAELYLKIQSSLHPKDGSILIPLNVSHPTSGSTRCIYEVPFLLNVGKSETLRFELLDDDGLTKEQEKKIVGCAKDAACLFWFDKRLFGAKKKDSVRLAATIQEKRLTVSVVETLTELVLDNLSQHIFDSYGTADYHVPDDPPRAYRDANPVVIRDGTVARAEVKIYYP